MLKDTTDGGEGSQMAVRGLDVSDAEDREVTPPRLAWFRDMLLPATIIVVFIADQLSKYAITSTLALHESWPAEGFFRITHGTNTGTAFGLFPNQTAVLVVLSLFAIAFLVYFYRTEALSSRLLRFAIGLQLGGAFGNLVDRVRAGEVVDFIDVGWWPIFNLADSSIVVGIAVLMSVVVLGSDRKPEARSVTQSDGTGE
jgi:signal peptidase II